MQLPLLSLLHGGLQLGWPGVGILNGQLNVGDGSLQGRPLAFEAFNLRLKAAEAAAQLKDLGSSCGGRGSPYTSQLEPAAPHIPSGLHSASA